ncbi:MAG: hypothetical protein ACLQGP_30175 [Isosphaeraceae bacterium]
MSDQTRDPSESKKEEEKKQPPPAELTHVQLLAISGGASNPGSPNPTPK